MVFVWVLTLPCSSDIDVMLAGHDLTYSDIMERLESTEQQLSRIINPTLLTPDEFQQRKGENQSFITRVLEQPKLWLTIAPTTGDEQ